MPRKGVAGIPHSDDTNHRIVRRPGQPFPDSAFETSDPDIPGLVVVNRRGADKLKPISPLVKLRAYSIPLMKVTQVIRDSNRDVGGRVVEMAETEYMVRGKGYLRGKGDIENLVVKAERGTPVLIRDIARVELGPDERRGLTELNGEGEVVSVVMARYGENAG
jgi:Cu/Ag efflux pump CusA